MSEQGPAPSTRPELACTTQYLAWYARRAPDAIAVVEAGIEVSYAAAAADLVRYVRALEQVPIRRGMLVGVETGIRYLHLQLLLACEILGATTVSLLSSDLGAGHPMARASDWLLAGNPPAPEYGQKSLHMSTDWLGAVAAQEVAPADLAILDRAIPDEQIARLLRTSGTTGAPKWMALSHARQQALVADHGASSLRGASPRPRFLCQHHLTLRAAHLHIQECLQQGGTVLFVSPEDVLAQIEGGNADCVVFALGDIQQMIRHTRLPPPEHKLRVGVFGAAVAPRLRQQIRDRMNARLVVNYSTNETGRIACVDDDGIGTLYPGVHVRIVDETGRNLPYGQTGLIHVRTGTMVEGYYQDPGLTATKFVDGWFLTGDLGRMLAADRLVLVGRADDMLNVGSVKIAPAPLEDQLRTIDGVTDAALLSVEDADGVSILLVAIEAEHGASRDLLTRIHAIVTPCVPPYQVLVLPLMPRTETGKVKRGDIRRDFLQSIGQRPPPGGRGLNPVAAPPASPD